MPNTITIKRKTTSYAIKNPEGLYFLTFATVGWVDVFSRKSYRDLLIESLQYCIKEKGLRLFCYVIMTNHVHMICRAREGYNLSDILRDFKKYTSKQIIDLIDTNKESRRDWMIPIFRIAGANNPKNKTCQLWQQDNHPIELFSAPVINLKVNYIHMNPVKAGFVERPEDYLYSSARNYAEMESVLEVELIG